jgi:5-methylcytosine-specific restriction endonuclease McrA
MSKFRKSLTIVEKDKLLQHQEYKCANNPTNPSINLSKYKCPMWILYNGKFDDSGYEFDHIEEFSITKNNNIDNFQALCPSCHSYKTKIWNKKGRKYTSKDIERGCEPMEDIVKEKIVKKRKYSIK